MSNYGNMLGSQSRQIFNRMKNFSYHIAVTFLQDPKKSEKTVIDTMTRLAHYENLVPEGWEEGKYFIGLLTSHFALVQLRKDRGRLDRTVYEDHFTDSSNFSLTGNRIYDLEKAVGTLNLQDQIILTFKVCFGLSDEDLGALLRLRPSAVSRRVSKSLFVLNQRVPRTDRRPYLPEDPAIHQAIFFKLKEQINRIEALSNLNKHSFSQGFERRAMQSIASGKSGSFFDHFFGFFTNKRTSVYAIGMSIFLLLVIAALMGGKEPGSRKAELMNQTEREEKAEKPQAMEKRSLPPGYYAIYDTTVLFVDPDSCKVYEALQGGEVKELFNLKEPVKENGRIMHVGKADEIVYVAFANGKGGSIQGQPAEFNLTPYWEAAWFRGTKKLNEEEKREVIAGNITYQFMEEEKE